MLYGPIITPACTGNDGSGTATVTSGTKITGLVHAIYVSYVGDDAATTDTTISTLGTTPSAPAYNILVATNIKDDTLFFPRSVSHVNTTGVAGTSNDQLIPVDDYVKVTVAQANTGDIIKVWLFML